MTEPVLGPSSSGSVVLELGPGIGAIVLRTPPELDGREIEISLDAAGPARLLAQGSAALEPPRRTHSQVRPRHTAAGVTYAAVYPSVPAGNYIVWRDASTAAMRVRVTGGSVTTASWPDPAGDPAG